MGNVLSVWTTKSRLFYYRVAYEEDPLKNPGNWEEQAKVWRNYTGIRMVPKVIYANRDKTKTSLMLRGLEISCLALPLHDLNVIGIDTCSAMSVSTKPEDFIKIDKSPEAQESVKIRGVGGAGSKVGGRGCLVVKATDCQDKAVWVIDPEGVYMEKTRDDPDFRVLGREEWKKHSLRVVEDYQTF